MQIFSDARGQDRHSAKRSFVLGERSLRAYLAGGNVRFLEDAEENLSLLGPEDQRYDDACFYLGVTKAQLRKADESIKILRGLRERRVAGGKPHADIANKIALQLAYAHIKTYTDPGYEAANDELARLEEFATKTNSKELLAQTRSIQVFLYAVMAGRSSPKDRRAGFAQQALALGDWLLRNARSAPDMKFEALNALGITWMRVAEANWDEFGDRMASWAKSQNYYDEALTVVPNAVRVFQNLARLRLIQAEHNYPKDRYLLLAEAKEYVTRSLEVNDQDQYPFYELAEIAVRQGEPEAALDYIHTGRSRPGAVKQEEWVKVESEARALRR